MFDYAKLEDGRIVGRVQQSDTLFQFGQMYGAAVKKVGLATAALALPTATRRRSRRG